MKKEQYLQESPKNWLFNMVEKREMIPVYAYKKEKNEIVFLESCLLPKDEIENELQNFNWDNGIETLKPECEISIEEQNIVYRRWDVDNGVEPLVIKKTYYGLATECLDVVEEFKLLFKLYQKENQFFDLKNEEMVVEIKDELVLINKQYLKTYLTIKDKVLVIYMERQYSRTEEDKFIERNDKNSKKDFSFNLKVTADLSILSCKKIIAGCSLKNCVIGVEEDKSEIFFKIGTNEEGEPIYAYYGQRDDLNSKKTYRKVFSDYPILFDRKVLDKYYKNSQRYNIGDNILECGSNGECWYLQIDNQSEDKIGVLISDLYERLPLRELKYWNSYNITSDSKLSETTFNRNFENMFLEPTALDLLFKKKFELINGMFEKEFGWRLFKPLRAKDQYSFDSLHVATEDTTQELLEIVLNITKVCVDSINEKEIDKLLVDKLDKEGKKLKGISKVERWFEEKEIEEYSEIIEIFKNLYNLRSNAKAHRMNDKYEKILNYFSEGSENNIEICKNIFNKLIIVIDYFIKNINNLK